ncbi:RcpC/CpaB family pilus assembly protein [Antrihabitans stalactiti]|uniref:Flagellar biosynthesis protein FlgA n=1 Tax=Antrihabitans stalactiti TaxID=2584121 RepID=A0A848KLB7_9NOCA|nr:RcpC/CpaB family pilus assembly protein [Antrihabitans stalactiti]NMN96587.1 flagellar biosynthesis protein FlgA [Antrihabitans stalactiti]
MDRRIGERALHPSLLQRISEIRRPHWVRTVAARRVLAGALLLAAVGLFLRGDPDADRVSVVVARHDLQPGRVIVADDVVTVRYESGSLPGGVLRNADDVIGRTLAGAMRSGEMLTDIAVLGPRLAEAAVGSADSRVVPIRLADLGVAELLREGDRVDVLTASDEADSPAPPSAAILATDAAVVLVAPTRGSQSKSERVVMLALPTPAAEAVAAASLTNALTVVLR